MKRIYSDLLVGDLAIHLWPLPDLHTSIS